MQRQMSSNVTTTQLVTGGALALGVCYAGSYIWEKVSRPETKAAQNELKEMKKICAAKQVDEAALIAVLKKLKTLDSVNKQELVRNASLFVTLCRGRSDEFDYTLPVVNVTLDIIRGIARSKLDNGKYFVAAGGVKVLFGALVRAYTLSMKPGPLANGAKELVEKLLSVMEEVVSFEDKEVVLPFEVPKGAAAALQLASMPKLASITMLLREEHGFASKRPEVLGIIASVTAIRKGAFKIAESHTETDEVSPIDHLLYFAANTDSRRDYGKAVVCIRNLVRFVPAVRARVLSTKPGMPGLSNLPRLRDQFIEMVDGGGVGHPPRTQSGVMREPAAVLAAMDALSHLLQNSDSCEATLEALLDNNERGLLALLGVLARIEPQQVRGKVMDEIIAPLMQIEKIAKVLRLMRQYSGTGENEERWGTGFRIVHEMRLREEKDIARHKMRRQQQQRMQQQMMMMGGMGGLGGMGGPPPDAEQMEHLQQMMGGMGGMPGMGGGMPPMSEEEMMHMMMQQMGGH